ncbi:hypothetical protein BpsM61_00001 [Bacillus phage vB_BpsM-61]|nr:hypothetical protein BpsM61_00001 [Bacillus phage vB_BpsM-61]
MNNWTKRDPRFPKPIQVVGGGRYPLYLKSDLDEYAEIKGIRVSAIIMDEENEIN